jgi:hypothetical protein
MTHTPAPWQYCELGIDRPGSIVDGLGYIRRDPEDGLEIAHLGDTGRSREENEANGNLIATAPELLAALKWARTCVPFPSDCHAAIVAVLARAECAESHD